MRPLILRRKDKATPAVAPEPEVSVAVKAARAAMAARTGGQSGSEIAPSRDPAPSRVAYRMQRLWLTPLFRQLTRIGAPLAISLLAGFWYFGDDDRRLAVSAGMMDIRRSVETRPEFMVQLVAIDGASPAVERLIREDFPLDLPISSFDLDLELMQAEIAELDMIERADLRIRPGGVLEIALQERVPAVVWRSRAGLVLLDRHGNQIRDVQGRTLRADLPLLAGDGAEDHVPEALALMRAAGPITTRLRGLVRVGQRRWDIALTRDQYILLPEADPVSALQQVMALDQAQDLLARDLTVIDMRNPLRPTLRMAPMAQTEMRRIKAFELGEPRR